MDLMTIRDTLCCSLLLLILLILPVHSEDKPATGDASIFSDLWSALTQTGKNPTCPGECVHAITSILCDHVLEEVSCGEPFLRCCVPNDSSYGTAVETSPPFDTTHTPLSEYSSSAPFSSTSQSLSSTQSSVSSSSSMMSAGLTSSTTPATFGTSSYLPWHTTMSSASSANYSTPFSLPTRHTSSHQSTITTTTERINSRCPGVCVASRYVRYCSNISTNGVCDHLTETCCLQSERDSTNITLTMIPNRNSSSIYPSSTATASTSPSTTTTSTTTTSTTISSATSTASSSSSPSTTTTTNPPTTNESADKKDQNQGTTDLPICEGICVSPLFALLCDEVESNKVCSNGGTCCMNREQPAVTTPPSIPECTGTCIPTFLSGVCTRPSELVLKTSNCMSGTICCHFQDRRPVNERPPPLFNGPPLRIPPHPSSNYPSMGPPHPPNIQHFQRPNIQLKPASGLRPLPPMSLQPRPPNYAPFIPNRKPQIQIPSPMAPPQPQPSSSLPPPEPELNEPEPIASEPETSGSEENPSEMELSVGVSDGSETSGPVNGAFPGGVPFCPGPCIAPIFRFTCFGGNAIYPKFFCAKQGQICCAALSDIQNYEANIIANNGIWKPSIPSSPNNTTLDEASSMQSSTVVLPPIKPPPRQATPYSCGIKGTQRKESPRIVGGSDALPGEWCWQVALINTENQYICGGALIGSQWVLTAAHCITNLVRNGESIYIRVGDYDLSAQIKSKSAQTQKVSTTYIHHNHNGLTLDNDIALLKMASPVQINDSICLVCLPARGSNRKPGQRCTVTGYGYKDEAGPIALKVREAEVPVVDDQECTVKINAVTDKTFMLPASSFCAGGEEGNDACQGDGGGPMVCEVDGFYELTGLVSWGFGCGRQDVPGVYVKVSNFIGWINQIISVNNQ